MRAHMCGWHRLWSCHQPHQLLLRGFRGPGGILPGRAHLARSWARLTPPIPPIRGSVQGIQPGHPPPGDHNLGGDEIDISAGHLQRLVSEDALQGQAVSPADAIRGSEGVAQEMDVKPRDIGFICQSPEYRLDGALGESLAAQAQEHPLGIAVLGTEMQDVALQEPGDLVAEGNDPLLLP